MLILLLLVSGCSGLILSPCYMPPNTKACGGGSGDHGYYFDTEQLMCRPFSKNKCGTTGNNFKTLGDCQDQCAAFIRPRYCLSLPARGQCKASLPRYFYNATTGTCQSFIYSGCGCSRNNFRDLDSCVDVCKAQYRPGSCYNDPETGPCRAHMPRYFYNSTADNCQVFIYGGCRGNANRFLTLDECSGICRAAGRSICHLPPETGPCLALFPRFYYDPEYHMCRSFTYGGCQGNANNFETEEQCLDTCAESLICPTTQTCKPVTKDEDPEVCICCDDLACKDGYRCCQGKCKKGVSQHPGKCPVNPPIQVIGGVCRDACLSDDDCDDDYKCCHTNQGLRCLEAELPPQEEQATTFSPQNSTETPPPLPVCPTYSCGKVDHCDDNLEACNCSGDCADGGPCCEVPGCGQFCGLGSEVREGSCPTPDNRICIQCYDQCHADDDCPDDQKCCPQPGCGQTCKDVI